MFTAISDPQTQPIDPGDQAYWSQVRSQFMLEPGHAYLNNAALGMPPKPVRDAVAAGFSLMSENPSKAKRDFHDYIESELRPAMAAFLGAETGEIALARNATEGLYHIVNGLDLAPGDGVLMTTQEHPSAVRPWKVRAERYGIEVREVHIPSPLVGADDILERIATAIDGRTKVLFFCHVTRGGYLYPVKRLCALARENGLISAVDGAQAVGMLDVDLAEVGSDLYTNSLHKWFLGPMGTGFLYVRAGARDRIRSAFAYDATPANPAFEPPGTNDVPVRAALAASLAFMEQVGIDRVEARTRFLSDYLKERLAGLPGARLVSGATPEISGPASTIFELEGVDAVASVPVVAERASIHIDEHRRDGHEAIRVSTHVYNTTAEIDRLIEALADLRPA